MTDRPIAFSPDMMAALIRELKEPGTGKTQTRRVLRHQPFSCGYYDGDVRLEQIYPPDSTDPNTNARWSADAVGGGAINEQTKVIPYAVGNRLYVREAWRARDRINHMKPSAMDSDEAREYICDGFVNAGSYRVSGPLTGKYRPPMFMPRWASRITLDVTDVRVEQVRDITAHDAAQEGCFLPQHLTGNYPFIDPGVEADNRALVAKFKKLWNSLNEPRGYGWDENPWVVAVTFKPRWGNIDKDAET